MIPYVCPRCRRALDEEPGALVCTGCASRYPLRVDAVPSVDFAPEIVSQPGLAQKVMESRRVAPVYERFFRPAFTALGSRTRYGDEAAFLDRWLDPVPGPVLDLACGSGRYTRRLARKVGPERVVGLDLSIPMLAEAARAAEREGLSGVRFVRGSALALPFADATVGAVSCFGALHLFPSPEKALEEIGRVLADGAPFACLTAAARPEPVLKGAQRAFARASTFRFFHPAKLVDAAADAGLETRHVDQRGMVLLLAMRRRTRGAESP